MWYTLAMRRSRPVLLVLVAFALCFAGAATLTYAHRGYRGVVYYWHATLRSPIARAPISFDEWIDPARRWTRDSTRGPHGDATWLFRDGLAYRLDAQGAPASPAPDTPSQIRIDQLIQQRGFAGFDQYWFAHDGARLARATLDGRPALRVTFPSAMVGFDDTAWLDPRTHALLQWRWVGLDGVPETLIYTRRARLVPGTLPADFFTPRQTGTSLWDRLLQALKPWLQRRP